MVRPVRVRALCGRTRPYLGNAWGAGPHTFVRDGIQQKAWFCGPPSCVIDGIKSIEAKYPGLEDFMIHWAEGLPPKAFEEQLRWFTQNVMPAFTEARLT